MADKINANKLGLTVGYFAALMHLVLIILVALGVANAYLGWILPLHFLSLNVSFVAFDLLTAVMLLIAAFVGGYVAGWVFAYIYNRVK